MTDEEIDKFLNFVIVGGGPTSCEFAGELQEFIQKDVKLKFPELAGRAKINIVNKAKKLLPSYATDIQSYTEREFRNDGINIIGETYVKECRKTKSGFDEVVLSNDTS